MTDNRRPSPISSSQESVADLLFRMARGEESALAKLYDRWAERVHTTAYWILQDRDEAEDVVEETFWQAWRDAGQYDRGRASGSAWLMIIARSRALDRLRAQRRRADWAAAPATANTLQEQVLARQAGISDPDEARRHSELATALVELPAEQREAVELAFLAGLSHSEIAARTSQPLGTVKTRIRLAMQKLRERLVRLEEELE